jgi:hypothetical protein
MLKDRLKSFADITLAPLAPQVWGEMTKILDFSPQVWGGGGANAGMNAAFQTAS